MKKKPFVIPVFIPHAGCPHDCIYCNQRTITGETVSFPTKEKVKKTIERFLRFRKKGDARRSFVAFYGGTFTALPLAVQKDLLDVAQEFIETKLLDGIRFSTRPDYIDTNELDFLSNYTIHAIELGAQSMVDDVLRAAARGHTSEDTKIASAMIKDSGYQLGIQIMVGLPRDTEKTFRKTVQEVIKLNADFVRIYPTLVIRDSALARLYTHGKYKALSLDKAVAMTVDAYTQFKKNGIEVIRMGLQPEPWFEKPGTILAGPYHPSFGELVVSAYYDNLICPVIASISVRGDYLEILTPRDIVSQVRGHGGRNIRKWCEIFELSKIEVKGAENLYGEIVLRSGKKEWKINCRDW